MLNKITCKNRKKNFIADIVNFVLLLQSQTTQTWCFMKKAQSVFFIGHPNNTLIYSNMNKRVLMMLIAFFALEAGYSQSINYEQNYKILQCVGTIPSDFIT